METVYITDIDELLVHITSYFPKLVIKNIQLNQRIVPQDIILNNMSHCLFMALNQSVEPQLQPQIHIQKNSHRIIAVKVPSEPNKSTFKVLLFPFEMAWRT